MAITASRFSYTVAVAIGGAVLIGTVYQLTRSRRKRLPPGPNSWPIIGNLFDLPPLPHHALAAMSAQHGPLMSLWMGSQLTIVISSPEVLKKTLRDQGQKFTGRWVNDFAKCSLHAEGGPMYADGGKNVALACGKYWKKSRKIFVQELMSMSFIKSNCIPIIQQEINSFVDAIKEKNGEPFDPHTWLQRKSLNIVFRLTYGVRFGRDEVDSQSSKMSELLQVINSIVKLGATGVVANYIPILKLFNGGLVKQREALVAKRDEILQGLLNAHRETLDADKPRDFLDVLLTRQEAEGLKDDEVTLIAWEFITAGTDTTSASMHWLVALLANHPKVQQRAHAEIDAVCKGRRVTEADQDSLPYVNAVLKEVMRLYPVVPLMVPYKVTEDVDVALHETVYTIPAQAQVLVNQFAIVRNDQYFDDAETFNPDRFLGKEAEIELRAADAPNDEKFLKFIPMGTGRRACAGYTLAKVELFMQAASLMQCFEWSPPEGIGKLALKEKFGIAVSPDEFHVRALFRSQAGNTAGATLS